MYLLKRHCYVSIVFRVCNSHSTMYLLKLDLFEFPFSIPKEFTFHHVSIKTELDETMAEVGANSHSTMYLLKHDRPVSIASISNEFTFHHVSIKTQLSRIYRLSEIYSHSTMYLLKLIYDVKR